MKAQDIMTKTVVTIGPDTTITDLAQLMVKHRISSVPVVVDNDHLVGIVTESDLLHRVETETERKRNWWVDMFVDSDTKAREFVKAHGNKAQDVMSRVVVTVAEDTPLSEVATMLDAHKFRRVPVVRDGRLVGIVSRSDLVRALAQATNIKRHAEPRDNGALNKTIFDALRKHPWLNTPYVTFAVDNGTVTLLGFVVSEEQRRAMKVLVEEIPGVTGVLDRLTVRSGHMAA